MDSLPLRIPSPAGIDYRNLERTQSSFYCIATAQIVRVLPRADKSVLIASVAPKGEVAVAEPTSLLEPSLRERFKHQQGHTFVVLTLSACLHLHPYVL
jgi:hypothetical protein